MDENNFFVLPSSIIVDENKTVTKNATIKNDINYQMIYHETYY